MQVQPLEGHLAERIRSREIAESHFVVELSNDPDVILTSMKSYAPLLTTVVVPGESGTARLVTCATPEEQRAFYAASRSQAHMTHVDLFTSIGGDWYGFVHGVVTSKVLATSEQYTAELVGLLPSTPDEDTVAGEIGLGWPMPGVKLGDGPGQVAHERVAAMRAHDAWLDALRRGDVQAIGDLYAQDAQAALRDPASGEIRCLEGREAIRRYYADLLGGTRVNSLDVVVRMVDRWFVFSELVARLDYPAKGEVIARLADVCVMGADNQILFHLGTAAGPDQ
jgi:SnoaL-like domain